MEECPCRYCTVDTGRSSTCHGTCEKYIKWKKRHTEQVALERRQRHIKWSVRTGHWYKTPDGHWRNRNAVRRRK